MCRYVGAGALVMAMMIVAMPHISARTALAGVVGHGAAQAGCAVTGTYRVGRRPLPMAKGSSAPAASLRAAPVVTRSIPVPIFPFLSGAITILTYSGCGQATSGGFSVARAPYGPIILERPRGRPAVPCQVPCRAPFIGVIGVSGTFVQDPAHPTDATYVSVSATITSTRLGLQMGRACSVQYGCPPPVVITSTATMTSVTGYLQAGDGQAATLSFLPPPMSGQAPVVMQLYGYHGVAPLPAPAPRDERGWQGA